GIASALAIRIRIIQTRRLVARDRCSPVRPGPPVRHRRRRLKHRHQYRLITRLRRFVTASRQTVSFVLLANRHFSAVIFAFIVINYPLNGYLLVSLMLGRVTNHGYVAGALAQNTLISTGAHLLMVACNRDLVHSVHPMIGLTVRTH